MKIKEALSSIRELENQFRKINKQEKGSSAVQELSSEGTDAVSVLVQQSETNSARIQRVAELKNMVQKLKNEKSDLEKIFEVQND